MRRVDHRRLTTVLATRPWQVEGQVERMGLARRHPRP